MRQILLATAVAAIIVSSQAGTANAAACDGTFSFTGALQSCTVAATGDYLIQAYGGDGGNGARDVGGASAVASGVYHFSGGASLSLFVGGAGGTAGYGGGGGGSFVLSGGTVLLVGGGGGGSVNSPGGNASLTTSGGGAAGGTGGNGGGTHSVGLSGSAGGGGGILSNGANGTSNFQAAAVGGAGLPNGLAGGAGGAQGPGGAGGFGGGGGGGRGGGGGGGGYSGGGGGSSFAESGGGGGSFFDALVDDGYVSLGAISLDSLIGNGQIVISAYQAPPVEPDAIPEPATWTLLGFAAALTSLARKRV